MRVRSYLPAIAVVFVLVALQAVPSDAQTSVPMTLTGLPVAITGRISSAEEGPMKGVLVSARNSGSTRL